MNVIEVHFKLGKHSLYDVPKKICKSHKHSGPRP